MFSEHDFKISFRQCSWCHLKGVRSFWHCDDVDVPEFFLSADVFKDNGIQVCSL